MGICHAVFPGIAEQNRKTAAMNLYSRNCNECCTSQKCDLQLYSKSRKFANPPREVIQLYGSNQVKRILSNRAIQIFGTRSQRTILDKRKEPTDHDRFPDCRRRASSPRLALEKKPRFISSIFRMDKDHVGFLRNAKTVRKTVRQTAQQ